MRKLTRRSVDMMATTTAKVVVKAASFSTGAALVAVSSLTSLVTGCIWDPGNSAPVVSNTTSGALVAPQLASLGTLTLRVGEQVSASANAITNSGGAIQNCVISPSLPSGLVLSSADCSVSGSAAVTSSETDYALTASNASGESTVHVHLKIIAAALVGQLDLSYNEIGIRTFDLLAVPSGSSALSFAKRVSGDKFLIAYSMGSNIELRLQHLDGTFDTAFGTDGRAHIVCPESFLFCQVSDVAVQADGKFVVAYNGVNVIFGAPSAIIRLKVDGTSDAGFTFSMPASVGGRIRLALAADGKFLALGAKSVGIPPVASGQLMRIAADGSLDVSFGTAGVLDMGSATAQSLSGLAVDPANGDIYLSGQVSVGSPTPVLSGLVQRRRADGTIDSTFGVNSDGQSILVPVAQYVDSAFDAASGSVLVLSRAPFVLGTVAGFPTFTSGANVVSKILPNGRLDLTYGTNGSVSFGSEDTLASSQSLKLLLQDDGGALVLSSKSTSFIVNRLTPAGVLDASFGTEGKYTLPAEQRLTPVAMDLTAAGKVIVVANTMTAAIVPFPILLQQKTVAQRLAIAVPIVPPIPTPPPPVVLPIPGAVKGAFVQLK